MYDYIVLSIAVGLMYKPSGANQIIYNIYPYFFLPQVCNSKVVHLRLVHRLNIYRDQHPRLLPVTSQRSLHCPHCSHRQSLFYLMDVAFFRSVVISTNQYLVVANRQSSGQLCDDILQIAENAKRKCYEQFVRENVNQYASLTGDALDADMPTHVAKFNSLAARIKFMSGSTAMVGELEITATANLLKRPVHVSNNHHGTVYRYGDETFTNVLPIHVKCTPLGDSCGHYKPVVSPSPPDSRWSAIISG